MKRGTDRTVRSSSRRALTTRTSGRRLAPEPSPRFVVRDARLADHPRALRLARVLDSINLPTGSAELRSAIARSTRSIAAATAGRTKNAAEATYVFVAEDRTSGEVVGTSMILAKHGTPESPHYFLEMVTDERYSKTLRKMFRHTSLQLRHSMDGPTEVGGLVVDPRFRRHPAKLGMQLSFVRFLYIAMHRRLFAPDVIAEIKPPLTPAGENRFWQSYGARVTGLTFREADRLSTRDKVGSPGTELEFAL